MSKLETEQDIIGILLKNKEAVEQFVKENVSHKLFDEHYHPMIVGIKEAWDKNKSLLTKHRLHNLNRDYRPDGGKELSPKQRAENLQAQEFLFAKTYLFNSGNLDSYNQLMENHLKWKQQCKRSKAVKAINAAQKNGDKDEELKAAQDLVDAIQPEEELKDELSEFLLEHIRFPTEALPELLQRITQQFSKEMKTPEDYIGSCLLASLASAIGRTYKLNIKAKWYEPASIWMCLVGEVDVKKSTPMDGINRYINFYEQNYEYAYKLDMEQYKIDFARYNKELAMWKSNRDTNNKPPKEPEKPVRRRIIIEDPTLEALTALMAENNRGLMLAVDEIAGWFGSFNKYNSGKGDHAPYLSFWVGKSYSPDRKGQEHISIPETYLSILGTTQPEVYRKAMRGLNMENGMEARFLAIEPIPVNKEIDDYCSDPELRIELEKLFDKILRIEMLTKTNKNGQEYPCSRITSFTAKGKVAFFNAYNKMVRMEQKFAIPQYLKGTLGKLQAYLGRFALIIQIIRSNMDEHISEMVDEHSVQIAEKLCYYYLAQANKIWGGSNTSKNQELLGKIKKYCKSKRTKVITTRLIRDNKYLRGFNMVEIKNRLQEMVNTGELAWGDEKKNSVKIVGTIWGNSVPT